METGARMLAEEYAESLRQYLAGAGEAALQRSYDLGRRAILDGLSLLELVSLHHRALEEAQQGRAPGAPRERLFEAAQTFLAESLSPFEMAHREFREAVTALRRLNQLLEEEAQRIAHALHDDAGQLLVSVHLALEAVARDLPPGTRERLRQARGLLDEAERHLRRLSHELRPTILDDLGLLPAVEFLAQGVTSRTGVMIEVEGARDRLPAHIETAIYRMVQEALTNATRHAQASRVTVSVARELGRVKCAVRDNGVGFDAAAVLDGRTEHGLGLMGMRERLCALGGQMAIDSAPGRGTELSIHIPLEAYDGDSSAARG